MFSYEKQKQTAGWSATWAWILSCAWLFTQDRSHGGVFSAKAVVFIFGGMFAAALVFGIALYGSQRVIAKATVGISKRSGAGFDSILIFTGWGLLALQWVSVFLTAQWLYREVSLPLLG